MIAAVIGISGIMAYNLLTNNNPKKENLPEKHEIIREEKPLYMVAENNKKDSIYKQRYQKHENLFEKYSKK